MYKIYVNDKLMASSPRKGEAEHIAAAFFQKDDRATVLIREEPAEHAKPRAIADRKVTGRVKKTRKGGLR